MSLLDVTSLINTDALRRVVKFEQINVSDMKISRVGSIADDYFEVTLFVNYRKRFCHEDKQSAFQYLKDDIKRSNHSAVYHNIKPYYENIYPEFESGSDQTILSIRRKNLNLSILSLYEFTTNRNQIVNYGNDHYIDNTIIKLFGGEDTCDMLKFFKFEDNALYESRTYVIGIYDGNMNNWIMDRLQTIRSRCIREFLDWKGDKFQTHELYDVLVGYVSKNPGNIIMEYLYKTVIIL